LELSFQITLLFARGEELITIVNPKVLLSILMAKINTLHLWLLGVKSSVCTLENNEQGSFNV